MWHRDPKFDRLKALEREELDDATEEWARRELRPHGIPEWFGAQLALWTARFEKLARWAKAVITVAGLVPLVLGAGYKLVALWRASRPQPAELPHADGTPTIATDRVPKPPPPK